MTLQNTICYFIIYSHLGWVLESLFDSVAYGKLCSNTGFLMGPFCPMYGIAVIILLKYEEMLGGIEGTKNRFKKYFFYFSTTVFMTVYEYLVGWLMENFFNKTFWDYSHIKYNIKGKVCLPFSICWGILVFFLLKIVHPRIKGNVRKCPYPLKCFLIISLLLTVFIDTLMSWKR